MALRSPAPDGLSGAPQPGTSGRGDTSWPAVAHRGRASAGALALVVMTTAACSANDPAAPPVVEQTPNPKTDPSDETGRVTTATADPVRADPAHADPATTAPADPRVARTGRSLAQRIAPLVALPEPIAEGFGSTGNAACDRYVRNYLRCIEQTMAPASIEAVRKSLLESTRQWSELGQGPGGSDALRPICEAVQEAGRSVVDSLGCEWK